MGGAGPESVGFWSIPCLPCSAQLTLSGQLTPICVFQASGGLLASCQVWLRKSQMEGKSQNISSLLLYLGGCGCVCSMAPDPSRTTVASSRPGDTSPLSLKTPLLPLVPAASLGSGGMGVGRAFQLLLISRLPNHSHLAFQPPYAACIKFPALDLRLNPQCCFSFSGRALTDIVAIRVAGLTVLFSLFWTL